ncbi:MAG: T9SS type A sorting domain-containing protein [Bacteroidetes bacterium]|nr:T9SS type A sorting domain-containing protein [Bacteroidota bacterium]
MNQKRYILILLLFTVIFICGWGATGHKIINRRSTFSFPSALNFLSWADSLAAHSSDADARRSSDPNEAPRHFIDIDEYPEFVANGRIPQDLDSLIALHGSTFVYNTGILPFSIMATTDSVKKYFQLHDYHKAMLHAADLGHYVGDGHQPLHITRNYDGQYTNQSGVHARYETQMINRDTAFITYNFENATYIPNINQFVFNFIYNNYRYVDSVLKYDSIAHAMAQNYSTTYYQIYWQLAGNFTTMLFNNASHFISSLIYTAWVNSGGQTIINSAETTLPENFYLRQNFPNPFNPSTTIGYEIPADSKVSIKVFDITGKEVTTLVNELEHAGYHSVEMNASELTSGIYLYKIEVQDGKNNFSETKRMILIK